MKKFLMFIDDADDAATYPVDNLLGMTCATDGVLLIKFKGSVDNEEDDSIALTITANTEKTVMKSIANAITWSRDSVIVVADDVNSKYVDSDITACAITLDS